MQSLHIHVSGRAGRRCRWQLIPDGVLGSGLHHARGIQHNGLWAIRHESECARLRHALFHIPARHGQLRFRRAPRHRGGHRRECIHHGIRRRPRIPHHSQYVAIGAAPGRRDHHRRCLRIEAERRWFPGPILDAVRRLRSGCWIGHCAASRWIHLCGWQLTNLHGLRASDAISYHQRRARHGTWLPPRLPLQTAATRSNSARSSPALWKRTVSASPTPVSMCSPSNGTLPFTPTSI